MARMQSSAFQCFVRASYVLVVFMHRGAGYTRVQQIGRRSRGGFRHVSCPSGNYCSCLSEKELPFCFMLFPGRGCCA